MNNHSSIGKSFACFAQTFARFAVKKGITAIAAFLIFFSIPPILVLGQSEKLSESIIELAEELASDDSDPEAVSIFTDRLHELTENPVKLNSSNENEISRLFFLSDFQVKALADYIHSSGRIVSVYELAVIPGFDKETAAMIIPFITLNYKPEYSSDSVRWRNSLMSNFSIKSENTNTASLGSNWRILNKYRFTSGGFSGGITAEKDPGERLLCGTPPLPDFLSGNLTYNGSGLIRRIIVGDYSARFGQGTNINTGIRRGISLTSPGYMSASDEIKAYTSTEENRFFRGLAAWFSIRNLEMSLFFSKNFSDASIASESYSSNEYIENLYFTGVHNTPSLLSKKDAVSEQAYGVKLSYNFNNLRIGSVWSETRFSLPLNLAGNDPGKIFDFKGNRISTYTIYYNSFIKKILLYGELSANDNKKYAVVQGISFRPSDRLYINFLFRSFDPGYSAFYGQGPGTGSITSNETALLGNFTFEAARHLFITGGCDIQSFPWLKYRCSAPSSAARKEIKIRFLPSEKLIFDASYCYRQSMVDNSETTGVPDQEKIITRSLKASARYSAQDNLILGVRIDYKLAVPSGSRGMVLLQEVNYSFRKIPVTIWARYCLFNTDDWLSRIYTYENDLLYSFSIPALAGEGSRSYVMAKWKISDFAELRIKFGVTSLVTIKQSSENIDEIKMQFRIWF